MEKSSIVGLPSKTLFEFCVILSFVSLEKIDFKFNLHIMEVYKVFLYLTYIFDGKKEVIAAV